MMRTKDADEVARWRRRALCCHYVGVFLRFFAVDVRGSHSKSTSQFVWAIGWHVEGGPEVLGVWPETGAAGVSPALLIAELQKRGIERIGVLVGPDIAAVPTGDARTARSQRWAPLRPLEVVASVEQCGARPADRRRLLAAEGYIRDLEVRLNAALSRHGSFASQAEAMSFLIAYVEREDRKIEKLVRLPEFRRDLALNTRRVPSPHSVAVPGGAAPTLH